MAVLTGARIIPGWCRAAPVAGLAGAARLEEVAPERLTVPSGSRIRVDYSDPDSPALDVKIQEAFGWRSAPVIADGRVSVVLRLLSSASQPVAVTADLPSFWRSGYPPVRGGRFVRGGNRSEQAMAELGVEHGDAHAMGREGVADAAGQGCDDAFHPQSSQVVAHLGAAVVGAEQSGNVGAKAPVGDAGDGEQTRA